MSLEKFNNNACKYKQENYKRKYKVQKPPGQKLIMSFSKVIS